MVELLDVSKLDTKHIRGLFFDIDDTFTTEGKITAPAYQALWQMYQAGLLLVPITGRPAGWCDHIARMWPVTAVVGENGAFYFMMKDGKLRKHFLIDEAQRTDNRHRLDAIRREILDRFPGAALASDQAYREFDLAIDFCEDVPPLPRETVAGIYQVFRQHGATAKISSIHVNGWFGDYTKLDGIRFFLKHELQLELDHYRDD